MKRSGQREWRGSGYVFKILFESVRRYLLFSEAVDEMRPRGVVLGTFKPILKHFFRNRKPSRRGRRYKNLTRHAVGLSARHP